MDAPITSTPVPDTELAALIEKAQAVYKENFNADAWFGRCIFLSWYCERGTCTFCFRSVTKHKIAHPRKARRSLASVVAEAMLIKGLGWRIEFLTGGYGVCENKELVRMVKLVSQVLGEKIWVNLGELKTTLLNEFKPYVQGIVSSIETVEPTLHKEVCPDKPIQPYIDMMKEADTLGYALAMTVVLGLGETRDHFSHLNDFIRQNNIDRITVYALRPVVGTPFTTGPDPLDVAWWVAKLRIAFPRLEIVVGTARHRIPEISLMLTSGANAITKLPATNIFNTSAGQDVEQEVKKAHRHFISTFTSKDIYKQADWQLMLDRLDVTLEEKEDIRQALFQYLDNLEQKGKDLFSCLD